MCTGDSAKYAVAKFTLWAFPQLPLTGYGPAKILPGIIWSRHTGTQLVITITDNGEH